MKKYRINGVLYLPIINMKPSGVKGEQKYVAVSINGTVFINEVYTESEIINSFKDNPHFKICDDLDEIVK